MMKKALELLQKYFGYTQFREGQQKVIESLMARQDTLAIMPTGAGKSLAYQIPALLFEGTAIVISPLISLMKDQVDGLHQYGVRATYINSSLPGKEVYTRMGQLRRGEFKLLYLAPERLESENFRSLLESVSISFMAIDEAHCVSQWGHDFRPSYLQLGNWLKGLPDRPLLGAFTATATPEVKEDIIQLLGLNHPQVFVSGFDRPNLAFSVLRGENKQLFTLDYVRSHADQSGIIYAATRKEVDSLHKFLAGKGVSIGKYHAGMSDPERVKNQEEFLYDEKPVMVATNAFGMGIDKSNVRYVIHYNMPKTMEAYYQEAGRAGRDGEPGDCILLFAPQDVILQRYLIEQSVGDPERRNNELKKIKGMVDYCHTPRCLRKAILEYFGEEDVAEECGNCGSCNDDREAVDITVDAQKIFSCIYRMKERFGITMVADVLKGSKNKKILEWRFDQLSTYGIMAEVPLQEIKDRINYLVAEEFLVLSDGEYPVVKLLPKAGAILKGELTVFQKVRKQAETVRKDAEPVTLFDRLKELRREIARQENVPPYIIFTDKTLQEMARLRPLGRWAMLNVTGVGERKMEKYGEAFLAVIKEFEGEREKNPAPDRERDVPHGKEGREAKGGAKEKIPSHMHSYQLYSQGYSLAEIAKVRGMTLLTVQDHLVRCNSEGRAVNWDDFIPSGQEARVLAAVRKAGGEKLRPIKDLLPEDVDWFTIRAVLEKHRER